MIGYLKGRLLNLHKDAILLDVQGVGYEVHVNSISTEDFVIGNEIVIYTFYQQSEYGNSLYGFRCLENKRILELIYNNTKGVGIKLIHSLVNYYDLRTVSDLEVLDIDKITAIKGLGKANAKKILLQVSNLLQKDLDLSEINKSDILEKKFKGEIAILKSMGLSMNDLSIFIHDKAETVKDMDGKDFVRYILTQMKK